MAEFDHIRAALQVMLHEAKQFNATVLREAGIGPFDLVAIRQAEAALATPTAPQAVGDPVAWMTTGPNGIFSKSREMLAFCQGADLIPLYAAPVASRAGEEVAPELCPYCDGSGESTARSGGGPDAWDEPCTCPRCKGAQTLRVAYNTLAEELPALQLKVAQLGIFHSHATRYGWAPNQTDGMQSFAELAAEWLDENATPPAPAEPREPLSAIQYNAIPELCAIRPSLYESVVRAIERAHGIAARSALRAKMEGRT